MQAAAPRARSKRDKRREPSAADLAVAEHIVRAGRQAFLEALPIATAVLRLGEDREVAIDLANARFVELVGGPCTDREVGDLPFLQVSGVAARATAFLPGADPNLEFETLVGSEVGGRHFAVRLTRLGILPALGRRCLATLIDRTAEVETERSLRAEMLRDSLTGLPNRTAFNERVEEALEDPGFLPGSHAVLVVDMRRFSRVNECVGALAGDELLIA